MHYFFTTKEQFAKEVGEGKFLEYAEVSLVGWCGGGSPRPASFHSCLRTGTAPVHERQANPTPLNGVPNMNHVQSQSPRCHTVSSSCPSPVTTQVHGNLYGTSFQAVTSVLESGRVCILDIDVQGARSVRKSGLKAIFVFIAPPSLEDLANRLAARGTETVEQITRRLNNAKQEIERYA